MNTVRLGIICTGSLIIEKFSIHPEDFLEKYDRLAGAILPRSRQELPVDVIQHELFHPGTHHQNLITTGQYEGL